MNISQEYLRSILSYNNDTGVFTWKNKMSARVFSGDVAGTIDNKGYRRIGFNGSYKRAHRLAWFYVHGYWPKQQIDHINRIRDDNRIENLRETSSLGNSRNRTSSINKFGVLGLSWCEKTQQFYSRITVKRKTKYIGYYPDMFNAICARKSAENKYFID